MCFTKFKNFCILEIFQIISANFGVFQNSFITVEAKRGDTSAVRELDLVATLAASSSDRNGETASIGSIRDEPFREPMKIVVNFFKKYSKSNTTPAKILGPVMFACLSRDVRLQFQYY